MSTLDLIQEARKLPRTIDRLIDALESAQARCETAWEKVREINADRNKAVEMFHAEVRKVIADTRDALGITEAQGIREEALKLRSRNALLEDVAKAARLFLPCDGSCATCVQASQPCVRARLTRAFADFDAAAAAWEQYHRPVLAEPNDARILELAEDILELQRRIDGLDDPKGKVDDRNTLHALMSQQATAAPVVARWVQARLRAILP